VYLFREPFEDRSQATNDKTDQGLDHSHQRVGLFQIREVTDKKGLMLAEAFLLRIE
jgi:hypothetical protein